METKSGLKNDTKEKRHKGELYCCNDPGLLKEQAKCLARLRKFNATSPLNLKKRERLLKKMFASVGENVYIEPPLHSNFGGKHVYFGKNVYANFNLTLVDDTYIYVGDYTMIGPNVTLITAAHTVEPELRKKVYQYNLPVKIGKNCWLGAGVTVLPGVTIGDNSVIGAGSVVTKDIPSDVVAYGNPCRVARPISGRDREFYYKDRRIDPNLGNGPSKE